MLDAITWTLLLVPASLAGLPIAAGLFRSLPSCGAFLAKPVGLLLVTYVGWLLLSLGPFANTRKFHLIILLTMGAVSVTMRYAVPGMQRIRYPSWRKLIVGELLFAGVFLGYALYRARNPEIWGTEKPMDFALLNGVVHSSTFPPQDPWLSDYSINYYYFGYAVTSAMTWISGVRPAVAFNLALGTFFAIAFVGCYSLGYDIVVLIRPAARRLAKHGIGAMTATLVMVCGNLYILHVIRKQNFEAFTFWRGLGWDATRIIQTKRGEELLDYTINEFPVFSFILGDLHPHVMALPFTVLACSVAISWLVNWSQPRQLTSHDLPLAVLTGWLLGALYVINSWDFPTFLVLTVIASLVGFLWFNSHRDRRSTILLITCFTVVTVASTVAYLPFHLNFEPFASGIGIVQFRSTISQFLTIFGLWILAAFAFNFYRLCTGGRRSLILLMSGGLLMIASWLIGHRISVILLCTFFVISAIATMRLRSRNIGLAAISVLFLGGFGLAAIPEVVFVQDFFGPPNSRMNTVFKLYYQVWPIVGIASCPALYWLWIKLTSHSTPWRIAWALTFLPIFSVLVLAATSYTVIAGHAKTTDFDDVSLDGLAYSADVFGYDVQAVEWLRNNVTSSETVLEASGMPYTRYGRVSAWTGIPTLVGWTQHEQLWRNMDPIVAKRVAAIDRIYEAATDEGTLQLLHQNHIDYVFVGSLERDKYGPNVVHRLSFLPIAFSASANTVIYSVPE